MKAKFFYALVWLSVAASVAFAQTTAFTYQGKLTDAGQPANGNFDLQFKLFDTVTVGTGAQQGATLVRNPVVVSAGVFTVTLDFGANVFGGADRYLEIGVRPQGSANPYTVLTPRQPITSTPYAIQTLNAQQLGGLPASGFVQNTTTPQAGANFNIGGTGTAGSLNINNTVSLLGGGAPAVAPSGQGRLYFDAGSGKVKVSESGGAYVDLVGATGVSGSGTVNTIPLWSAGTTLGDSLITQAGLSIQLPNNVGLGVGAQGNRVQFGSPNSETGMSISGASGRADLRYDGMLKLVNGPGGIPPATNGIAIDTDGDVGIGTTPSVITTAKLEVSGTINNNVAVFGASALGTGVVGGSNNGTGVEGRSNNGTGVSGSSSNSYGVYGSSDSVGVYGHSTSSVGVEGYSANLGSSSVGIGVKGSGSVGVYGTTNSGGLAGSFFGNVNINGTLSKSAGSFKIDHPLDPANKYLSHSFVESPDMMNIYNGNATLDAQGEAVIELPEWFGALNDKFRYQLTSLEAPGPNLHIAQKIADNRFRIAGGAPGLEVSWQVTGVRKDAFANKHRIPVEEEKPEKERGSYLHPTAFQQPEERGVQWKLYPEMMQRMKEEREKAQRRAAGETKEKDKR